MATPRLSLMTAGLLTSLTLGAAELPPPAYQLAAQAAGVPSHVLYGVALTESGTRLSHGIRPWPWTLNIAGEGFRFKNRQAACTALLSAIEMVGAKRVDAGLGQINIGWNGHYFNTPCEALDPYKNLRIAARLLRGHYDDTGDWVRAAGKYHHPAEGIYAKRYRAGFSRQVARVMGIKEAEVPRALGLLQMADNR